MQLAAVEKTHDHFIERNYITENQTRWVNNTNTATLQSNCYNRCATLYSILLPNSIDSVMVI